MNNQNIMPVYLKIENPIEMKDVGDFESVPDLLSEIEPDWSYEQAKDMDLEDVRKHIKSFGHDGIKYINTFESQKRQEKLDRRDELLNNIIQERENNREEAYKEYQNLLKVKGERYVVEKASSGVAFGLYRIKDKWENRILSSYNDEVSARLGASNMNNGDKFDYASNEYTNDNIEKMKKELSDIREDMRKLDNAETGDYSYIAFEKTQIKSATGNKGTYDEMNPDIMFARVTADEEGDWFEESREQLDIIGKGILRAFPDITEAGFMERMNAVLARAELTARVTEEQSGVILRGILEQGKQGIEEQSPTNDTNKNELEQEQNLGKEPAKQKKVIAPGMDERRFNKQIQRDEQIQKEEKDILDKDSLYRIKANKVTHAEAMAKIEELGGIEQAYTALIDKGGLFRFMKSGYGNEELENIPGEVKIEMGMIVLRRFQEEVNKSGVSVQDILDGKTDIKTMQALNKSLNMARHLMERGTDMGRQVQIFATFSKLSPEGLLMFAKRVEREGNRKIQKLTEQDIEGVVQQLQKENAKAIEELIKKYEAKIKRLEQGIGRRQEGIGEQGIGNREEIKAKIKIAVDEWKSKYNRLLPQIKQIKSELEQEKELNAEQKVRIEELLKEIEDLTKKLDEAGIKQKELEEIVKKLEDKSKELEEKLKRSKSKKQTKKKQSPTNDTNKSELEKEQEKREEMLSTAAEKLAKRISDTFKQRVIDEQKALIRQMVKTLFGVAVEKKMVDVEKIEPEKMIKIIGKAIKSEKDYYDL